MGGNQFKRMQGEVTKRFINCLNYLKDNYHIPSTRQFALTIGIHPQCISDICRNKREVNNDIIEKAVQYFNLNPVYLFTGKGSFLLGQPSIEEKYNPILTVVTDENNNERIVYVPVDAQAGYGNQLHDSVFIKNLPTFSLPGSQFQSSTHRCFDVTGDSMEPTLYTGDKIICSFVDPDNWLTGVRNNYVYVLITKSSVVVKRVANNLKKNGTLLLISDNNFYAPYELELKDLLEVWIVSVKISPFMPSPSNIRNGLHNEVDLLKDTIADQSKLIQSLNRTVEKLLRENRSPISR